MDIVTVHHLKKYYGKGGKAGAQCHLVKTLSRQPLAEQGI